MCFTSRLTFLSVLLRISFINQLKSILIGWSPPTTTVLTSTLLVVPFCAQCLLVLKVIALYPPQQFSRASCLSVYLPAALIKLGRVANIAFCVFQIHHHQTSGSNNKFLPAVDVAFGVTSLKAEVILQLVDNTYVHILTFRALVLIVGSAVHRPCSFFIGGCVPLGMMYGLHRAKVRPFNLSSRTSSETPPANA